MADIFDTISDWLLDQAIENADLTRTIDGFARRLVNAGVPVCRIVVGRGMAHPVIGLTSLIWKTEQHHVDLEVTPPTKLGREQMLATPFGYMGLTGEPVLSARLTDPGQLARFDLFGRLAAEGITHYLALSRSFAPPGTRAPRTQAGLKGMIVAYCTRRHAGFTEAETEGFQRLMRALSACVRVAVDGILVSELLDMYLGRLSGSRVLTGQTMRGESTEIDCALFYSDMRNSVHLSHALDSDQYLALLNDYFDCTAGAVLDHGGEVLKFIGDGVLAIFPFDGAARPPAAMCAAALSSAREAFARARTCNSVRKAADIPEFGFGVGLSVGRVLYGNVGSHKRLDFTATGSAVGLASRCEALTKALGREILATGDFVDHFSAGALPQGDHDIRGVEGPVPIFAFDA